jgi:hypothetical protein
VLLVYACMSIGKQTVRGDVSSQGDELSGTTHDGKTFEYVDNAIRSYYTCERKLT